ncbi:Guanylate kinase, putative [Angomonas deanei]|uniref:Guanylate kinase, putative n=1 Tax=Angomonas deanei TaxID=59799 RepID=A0A7G2C6R3_9TRYP|nr:Guanylate kinase, putative [Angomonas deanei]
MSSTPHARDVVVFIGPSGSGKTTVIQELQRRHPHFFSFCVSHTTRPPRTGEENGKQYYFVNRPQFVELVKQKKMAEYTLLFPRENSVQNSQRNVQLMEKVLETDFCHIESLLELEKSVLGGASEGGTQGTFYGTSKQALMEQVEQHKTVLMDTDLKGAISLDGIFHKKGREENDNEEKDATVQKLKQYACCIVLILPPSLETVRARLEKRHSETPETLAIRMAYNAVWMRYYKKYSDIFDYVVVNDDLETCVRQLEELILTPEGSRRESRRSGKRARMASL